MKFRTAILLLCLTSGVLGDGLLESIGDAVSSILTRNEQPKVSTNLTNDGDDSSDSDYEIIVVTDLVLNANTTSSNASDSGAVVFSTEVVKLTNNTNEKPDGGTVVEEVAEKPQVEETPTAEDVEQSKADKTLTDTVEGAEDGGELAQVVNATEGEGSSVLDKVKSVISEVIDYLPGGKASKAGPSSEKPNVVDSVEDTNEEMREDVVAVGSSNQSCILSCTHDTFSISAKPKKLTIEETSEKINLQCQVDYKDDAYIKLNVEFEWIFTPPYGDPCSLGPSQNRKYCDSDWFSYSSESYLGVNSFISEVQLFGVTTNHTGTFDCLFQAICCLPYGDDNDIDIFTIEASSNLLVFLRPNYMSHLAVAGIVTAVLCLLLCIAVFLYFRFGHKIRSNVPDLDNSKVKYKQMQMMTPPVMVVEDFYCITEDDTRDC